MTLALIQLAKQQQLGLPAALLLMAPWVDFTQSGNTEATLTVVDPILQHQVTPLGAGGAWFC